METIEEVVEGEFQIGMFPFLEMLGIDFLAENGSPNVILVVETKPNLFQNVSNLFLSLHRSIRLHLHLLKNLCSLRYFPFIFFNFGENPSQSSALQFRVNLKNLGGGEMGIRKQKSKNSLHLSFRNGTKCMDQSQFRFHVWRLLNVGEGLLDHLRHNLLQLASSFHQKCHIVIQSSPVFAFETKLDDGHSNLSRCGEISSLQTPLIKKK